MPLKKSTPTDTSLIGIYCLFKVCFFKNFVLVMFGVKRSDPGSGSSGIYSGESLAYSWILENLSTSIGEEVPDYSVMVRLLT
jgi:hypothetical protein